MIRFISLLFSLLPAIASATEEVHGEAHAAGHAEGIPSIVWVQAFNFVLYAAIIYFVLRKPIKSFFNGRQENFKQALVKAQAARHEAEQKRQEIHARLTNLESTSEESLAKARAEAEALKAKILQDAAELSQRLKEEARRTAELEIERAKTELREELLASAVAASRKLLSEKMADQDQKRLQAEFVDKIQVVP
jgi:F-type H+-transporting ATPase subunit b